MSESATRTDPAPILKGRISTVQSALDALSPEQSAQFKHESKRVLRRIDNALHAFLCSLPPTILSACAHEFGCLMRPYMTIMQKSKLLPRTTKLVCEHLPTFPIPSIPFPSISFPGVSIPGMPTPVKLTNPFKPTTSASPGNAVISELTDELLQVITSLSPEESEHLGAQADQVLSEIAKRLNPDRVNAWLTDHGQVGAIMRTVVMSIANSTLLPRTVESLTSYVVARKQGAQA